MRQTLAKLYGSAPPLRLTGPASLSLWCRSSPGELYAGRSADSWLAESLHPDAQLARTGPGHLPCQPPAARCLSVFGRSDLPDQPGSCSRVFPPGPGAPPGNRPLWAPPARGSAPRPHLALHGGGAAAAGLWLPLAERGLLHGQRPPGRRLDAGQRLGLLHRRRQGHSGPFGHLRGHHHHLHRLRLHRKLLRGCGQPPAGSSRPAARNWTVAPAGPEGDQCPPLSHGSCQPGPVPCPPTAASRTGQQLQGVAACSGFLMGRPGVPGMREGGQTPIYGPVGSIGNAGQNPKDSSAHFQNGKGLTELEGTLKAI